MTKKIIITGGLGYIGTELCKIYSGYSWHHKIIVIDNQSTDDTFEKIKSIKKKNQNLKNKIILAQNKNNYGLGGSLKNAFIFSILNKFDYSIIIHSDEQGESETILSQFIQQIEKNPNIDFFMASRFIKESKLEGYSKIRIIGNLFFNFLTYILTRVKLTDSGCGIIAVKTEILKSHKVAGYSENQ